MVVNTNYHLVPIFIPNAQEAEKDRVQEVPDAPLFDAEAARAQWEALRDEYRIPPNFFGEVEVNQNEVVAIDIQSQIPVEPTNIQEQPDGRVEWEPNGRLEWDLEALVVPAENNPVAIAPNGVVVLNENEFSRVMLCSLFSCFIGALLFMRADPPNDYLYNSNDLFPSQNTIIRIFGMSLMVTGLIGTATAVWMRPR